MTLKLKVIGRETGTYVDHFRFVSLTEVVYDARLVQEGQISDIFDLVKLWRVHLLQTIETDRPRFIIHTSNVDHGGIGIGGGILDDPSGDVSLLVIRKPHPAFLVELGGGSGVGHRLAGLLGRRSHRLGGGGRLGWRVWLEAEVVGGVDPPQAFSAVDLGHGSEHPAAE